MTAGSGETVDSEWQDWSEPADGRPGSSLAVCVGVLVLLATAGICVVVMWVSAARFERTVVCPGGPGVGDRPAPLVVPAREAVVSVESRS